MIQIFWIVLQIIIIYNCFIRVNKDFVIFCKHLSRDHLHLLFHSQGFFIIIIARLANYVSLSSRKESQIEAQVDFSHQRLRTFVCLHGKGRWSKIETKMWVSYLWRLDWHTVHVSNVFFCKQNDKTWIFFKSVVKKTVLKTNIS